MSRYRTKCKNHPRSFIEYFCPRQDCKNTLCCTICKLEHAPEHFKDFLNIADLQQKTFTQFQRELVSKLSTTFRNHITSSIQTSVFQECFLRMIQQNRTTELDEEDIVDFLTEAIFRKMTNIVPVDPNEKQEMTIEKQIFSLVVPLIKTESANIRSIEYPISQFSTLDIYGDRKSHKNKELLVNNNQEALSLPLELASSHSTIVECLPSEQLLFFWNPQQKQLYLQDLRVVHKEVENGYRPKTMYFKTKTKYDAPEGFQWFAVLACDGRAFSVLASRDELIVLEIIEQENIKASEGSARRDRDFEDEDNENEIPKTPRIFREVHSQLIDDCSFMTSDRGMNLIIVDPFGLVKIHSLRIKQDSCQLLINHTFQIPSMPKKILIDETLGIFLIHLENKLCIYKSSQGGAKLVYVHHEEVKSFDWHCKNQTLLVNGQYVYKCNGGQFHLIKRLKKAMDCVLLRNGILILSGIKLMFMSLADIFNHQNINLDNLHKEIENVIYKAFDGYSSKNRNQESGYNVNAWKLFANNNGKDHVFAYIKSSASEDGKYHDYYSGEKRSLEVQIESQSLVQFDL